MDYKTSYENAEEENDKLRSLLEWCTNRLSSEDREELKKLVSKSRIVPCTIDDERRGFKEVQTAISQLANHVEPLISANKFPSNPYWFGRLDYLIDRVRQYEPKEPVIARVGNNPNVFRPVKMFKEN